MLEFFKLLIYLIIVIFISSCTSDNILISPRPEKIEDESSEIKLSKQGQYLFGILIDKKTEQFFKKILPDEKYDGNIYELIKIYSTGAYPSFEPNQATQTELKDSLFRDDIFDGVKTDNKQKIIYVYNFNKDKFLKIAKDAIDKAVEFTVDLETDGNINEEYAVIELLISHKPSLKIKKVSFFINESEMYGDLIHKEVINIIKQRHIYKLAIPNGKNKVKVSLLSIDSEEAADETIIESSFIEKPTLHTLAIGVNEFPKWGRNKYLENAINDANLVKEILQRKGNKLFKNINIRPYTLKNEETTKDNIEKLIKEIRNNVRPNDYFLFYVASHGFIEKNKYYFAPSDFERIILSRNQITEDQISEYLINIPTIFRIAILDTCHAGKEVEVIKRDIRNLPLGRKEGVSVLTAAKTTQIANDRYKDTGHGLFTYVLAQGLNGFADYNKDFVVDSMEIAQYVKDNVGRLSRTETPIIQDAMVLPDPKQNYNRRFEITFLEQKKFRGFQPNVFTPRESQLYIDAMQREDAQMMNGIIRNNTRHRYNNTITPSIDSRKLTVQKLINTLIVSGSVDIDINFAVDSTDLTVIEMEKLKIIAKALQDKELQNKRILLEGHTDHTGTSEYNMDLSQRRADSVAKSLIEKFNIMNNRLSPMGFGEMYPIADNETENGRRKNRRVSIFIYE